MIYTVGDLHANQLTWAQQVERVLKPGDTLIVCGDFGVGFWNGRYWSEETFYDHIAEQEYTVLFVDGNHENFTKLEAYPVEQWNGGRVHRLRPNLIHLMRGEVYTIEGTRIFTFGGGYSLDRYRRRENETWWAREMPSEEEYANGLANLEKVGFAVDFILTHTAPGDTVYYMTRLPRLGIKGDVFEEMPLTGYLDEIRRRTTYRRWYFGHFHVDEELWRDQVAQLCTVRELETGSIVRRWSAYED